ncbi:MAG: dTDP-4-dehydrorhamnose 3,5-epimerase family protein [Terriglobales bacterium]
MIQFELTPISGAVIATPDAFADERGFFYESFRADRFAEHGIPTAFVQDNHSRSRCGVVRGLHFQWQPPMGKLMQGTFGSAFLMAGGHPPSLAAAAQAGGNAWQRRAPTLAARRGRARGERGWR